MQHALLEPAGHRSADMPLCPLCGSMTGRMVQTQRLALAGLGLGDARAGFVGALFRRLQRFDQLGALGVQFARPAAGGLQLAVQQIGAIIGLIILLILLFIVGSFLPAVACSIWFLASLGKRRDDYRIDKK